MNLSINNRTHEPIPLTTRSNSGNPLSFAQERLWFLDQFEGSNKYYNIPLIFQLNGKLDIQALQDSFNLLVSRQESFRTYFIQNEKGVAVQQLIPQLYIQLIPEKLNHEEIHQAIYQEIHSPFNLAVGPLFRIYLFEINPQHFVLLFNHHQIISDEWSVNIILSHLSQFYSAFHAHQIPSSDILPVQYIDFAAWQRQEFKNATFQSHLQFWKDQLADYSNLALPLDLNRPAHFSYRGACFQFQLDSLLSQKLDAFAQQNNTNLYTVLLMAFSILLSRYSAQDEILVGTPVANRAHKDTEHLVGLFTNTIVLRNFINPELSVSDCLRQVAAHTLDAWDHQAVPFEKIIEMLHVPRDCSRHPIFQVLFSLQSLEVGIPGESHFQLPGIQVQPDRSAASDVCKLDLSLFMEETPSRLIGSFEYCTDLFYPNTIVRMAQHFERLLQAIIIGGKQNIKDLTMLSTDERRRLLIEINQTTIDYPRHLTIHQLFESQAQKTPDQTAVVFKDKALSYQVLNQQANRLAVLLRARYFALKHTPLTPNCLIGLCLERSIDMIVAILAILKAGAAYVPLDPDYPQERLEYMIEDSHEALILTQQFVLARVGFLNRLHRDELIILDTKAVRDELNSANSDNMDSISCPQDLAYAIYTSGSTGKPKGTLLEHRGIVNRIHWMHSHYGLTEHDRILQKTPFSFDVSVWELLWPILYGGQLVFAQPGGHKDLLYLLDAIDQFRITKIHFVPSMLQVFIDYLEDSSIPIDSLRSLTQIFCSGEALPWSLARRVLNYLPFLKLHNLYGPTEASIDVSFYQCDPTTETRLAIAPIGKPISNIQLYILDKALHPCPIGIPGELYIGGIGLARGYLNQAELTRQRFIPNPFAHELGLSDSDRIYKSGDLVRWLQDSSIDYLGRTDFQVKIRGFRIELGEIEAVLTQHAAISQACVIAREKNGEKYLVGYYVLKKNQSEPHLDQLRNHLSKNLPDYMIPAVFIKLDALPLTSNGKINRSALLENNVNLIRTEYFPPRNHIEQVLEKIWCDLLNVKQAGIYDHFFRLGGHSLLTIQLVSRIRLELHCDIFIKAVFDHPRLADLALFISQQIMGKI